MSNETSELWEVLRCCQRKDIIKSQRTQQMNLASSFSFEFSLKMFYVARRLTSTLNISKYNSKTY